MPGPDSGLPLPDLPVLPSYRSLIPAGRWRRTLPVSLALLFENVLDWQRLAGLHRARFRSVVCQEWASWGWRAALTHADGGESVVKLLLNQKARRWVLQVLDGPDAPAEVWTRAQPLAPRRVEIVVDFFVFVGGDRRGAGMGPESDAGRRLADLWTGLYDDDVAMMVERQRQLDVRVDRARAGQTGLDLGPRESLNLPLTFVLGGRSFRLVAVDAAVPDGLLAFPARCPHMLGPLHAGERDGLSVTCPWHGFRFDIRSGANLSGQQCVLADLPRIHVDRDGRVRVTARH